MAGYTVAILKDGFEYWVFDTHSRNVNGKPNNSGSADNTGMAISEDYNTASYRKQSCETLPQESRMGKHIKDKSAAGLLLTMAEYTIAILKDGPDYWVLDTHSRDVNGRPSSNGSAAQFGAASRLPLTAGSPMRSLFANEVPNSTERGGITLIETKDENPDYDVQLGDKLLYTPLPAT